MFIFIYLLEGYLLSSISYEESVISMVLENFTFPNPFFTATMYFLIIVFLFLTPNYITTKKRLIIYRCMALIPIFVILIAFFLSKSDIIFGFTFKNYWIKQLFVGDRFSLSILAISYLVIIFFVRLYYKKK